MDLKNSLLLANMLKNKQEIKYMPITAVGTPIDVDYVVSGFSANDYIVNSRSFDITSNFEINLNLKTWSGTGSSQYIMGLIGNVNWSLYFGSSGAGIGSSYGGSYWNSLASNMTVGIPTNINIKGDGTNITVTISQQGYSKTSTKTIAELGFNGNYTLNFGRGASSSLPFTSGEIDFNNSYEIRNGIKYNYQFAFVVSKIGSLTINNNVITGFSDNDYLQFPDINSFNSFEMKVKFKLTEDYSVAKSLMGCGSYQKMAISPYNIRGLLRYNYNGSDMTDNNLVSYTVLTDIDYFGIFRYDNNVSYIGISTDDISYTSNTKNISVGATVLPPISSGIGNLKIGNGLSGGTIYLNECYIVVNAIKYKIIVE